MTLAEAIGKRVANLLEERSMMQYQLYKIGGIPRPTISTVILAKNKTLKTDTVYQIASALGLTLKEFFDDSIFDKVSD